MHGAQYHHRPIIVVRTAQGVIQQVIEALQQTHVTHRLFLLLLAVPSQPLAFGKHLPGMMHGRPCRLHDITEAYSHALLLCACLVESINQVAPQLLSHTEDSTSSMAAA